MANSGIYTTALMDHNAHPDYKYEMDDATHTHEGINPSCGDELMIKGKELTEQDKIDLDEAAQLQDISHMPARVKCAELAWRTLDGMLRENADAAPATTE